MTSGRAGRWTARGAGIAAFALLLSVSSSALTPPAEPSAAPPTSPLEQRLAEAWRWRLIDGPGPRTTMFRFVRAGRGGGLLAMDEEGLAAFDGWTWTRGAGWNVLTEEDVSDVAPLQGGLLLTGQTMLNTVDAHGALTPLGRANGPASVSRACQHEDGQVHIAFEGRIQLASIDRLEPLLEAPPEAGPITAIAHERDGTYWCAAQRGFFRHQAEAWERMGALPSAPELDAWYPWALNAGERLLFVPTRIDKLRPCVLWDGKELSDTRPSTSMTVSDAATVEDAVVIATTTPDLVVWREGRWNSVRVPGFSGQDNIVSLAALGDDHLAVVFNSGRLAVCDLGSHQWEAWDTRAAGAGANVNAMAPSKRGGFWVATDEGVLRFDGVAAFEDVMLEADGEPLHEITGLCETDDGDLWVGSGSSFKGAWRLHDGEWERHADEENLGWGYVHQIRKVGDEVWFTLLGGVYGDWDVGGLVRLKDGRLEPFLSDAQGQRLSRSYDLIQRRDGTLLAGTRGALRSFDGQSWGDETTAVDISRTAFALHEASDGAIWMGFGLHSSGVGVLRNGQFSLLTADSWRRSSAASFAETPDGRLWFASDKGLFLVTWPDCHEVSGLLPIRKFWPLLPDAVGGLWLGTTGAGLLHFKLDDREPPQVRDVTMRFSEGGDAIASWRAVDRWNATPPEELSFRLLLDGAEWKQTGPDGSLQENLGRLDPGPHTLQITALDNLGNDHGDPTPHTFHVPPPAWRSTPVLLEASATVVVVVVLLIVMRTRRRERAVAAASQKELTDRLSQLSLRLLSSQEDERRNLSREMHDDLGQLLTAACLDIERAARLEDVDRRQEALRNALRAARDTQRRVREISHMLRPSELDDHGLPQAVATVLSDFTARSGIDIDSRVDLEVDHVPSDVANSVFRILQEALTNILRHARASTAYVTLRATAGCVELSVRDDGAGFAPEALTSAQHYGLLGMRERSELLGGKFSISSRPGGGTEVFVSIPIPTGDI